MSPGARGGRQVPGRGDAVVLAAVTGDHRAQGQSDRGRARRRGPRPRRQSAHSPVLSAVDVQRVGVRVFALHRHVAGRVAGVFPDDAEAVDAGHLRGRLAAAQPREEPAHLVRQVV